MSALGGHATAGAILAGKYRVERVLGAGGMGVVVSAVHVELGARVAIKLVRPDASPVPASIAARFTREARIAASIDSDHVARVFDLGSLPDGTQYMVMDHLDGADLHDLLVERGALPVAEAVDYVLQACEAIALAHAAGVIHRDLNPTNLFVAKRPRGEPVVKVLDFGIARLENGFEHKITASRSLLGSPIYMAPEQMQSPHDVDERADVWSLGTILYELLAGQSAFDGATVPEACAAVMLHTPAPFAESRRDVPEVLEAIVFKCLAKSPSDRWASARELASALEPFARGVDVPATSTTRPVVLPPPATALAERPHSYRPVAFAPTLRSPVAPRRRIGWRSAALKGVALFAVLVGGGVAARLFEGDHAPRASTAAPVIASGRASITANDVSVVAASPAPSTTPASPTPPPRIKDAHPRKLPPSAPPKPAASVAPSASVESARAIAPPPASPSLHEDDGWKWGPRE
jgi:serine/threonine-protein kinase